MDQPVIRTYLEMRASPLTEAAPAPDGAYVERLERCPPELYRQLYAEVGRAWSWFDRLWWTDDELAAHLGRPEVSIRVLHLNGAPAGYYELVRHPDRSVEIGYFGLMPHAIGRGLGRWLLGEAIAGRLERGPGAGLVAHLHPGSSRGTAQLPQGWVLGHGNRAGGSSTGAGVAGSLIQVPHAHRYMCN